MKTRLAVVLCSWIQSVALGAPLVLSDGRLVTLAGEGIELPIATDHNLHIDYTEAAHRLGAASHFTPVTGNEVATPAGHFNLFPVQPDARVADFTQTDWPRLMAALRTTPGALQRGFASYLATIR